MSRRNTISHKSPTTDYPEHLNPFRDDGENEDGEKSVKNNRFNTVGRRNSRLSSSFRMRTWSMFSSKNPKSSDQQNDEPDPSSHKTSKTKFSTLTPKLSRQILDVLSPRRSKSKLIFNSNSTEVTATDFQITPKTSRESYAITIEEKQECAEKPNYDSDGQSRIIAESAIYEGDEETTKPNETSKEEDSSNTESNLTSKLTINEENVELPPPKPESRVNSPPVPLPRTILPIVRQRLDEASTSDACSRRVMNSPSDGKYITQGARPKKKRQAPLPPSPPPATTDGRHRDTDLETFESPSAISPAPESSAPESSALHLDTLPSTTHVEDVQALLQNTEQH